MAVNLETERCEICGQFIMKYDSKGNKHFSYAHHENGITKHRTCMIANQPRKDIMADIELLFEENKYFVDGYYNKENRLSRIFKIANDKKLSEKARLTKIRKLATEAE